MTHKQWFNNVLHLHPVHEEGAQTAHSSLANCLGFTCKAEEETHSLRHLLSNCNGGRHRE